MTIFQEIESTIYQELEIHKVFAVDKQDNHKGNTYEKPNYESQYNIMISSSLM